MRILHLIDTGGPGGAETILATIVTHLPMDRYRSRVVLPAKGWLSQHLEEAGVDTVLIPNRGVSRLSYLRALRKEIVRFNPDLIHTHLFTAAVYGSLASGLSDNATSRPVVSTFHGRPDVREEDPFLALKARLLTRSSNRLVYVSRDLQTHLEPLFGAPHLGCVIHNGVPAPEAACSGRERQECGAGPDDILIGAVGNLREPKDYPNLLRAARQVRNVRSDVHFVIVGEGTDASRQSLEAMLDDLELRDTVTLLGFRSDVGALIQSFDLFASSSATEGLPLATAQAMRLGKPVVATACGGVPELLSSGEHGLLVPPRDAPALAAGVLEALSKPEMAKKWGENASARVSTYFSVERMVHDYRMLFEAM